MRGLRPSTPPWVTLISDGRRVWKASDPGTLLLAEEPPRPCGHPSDRHGHRHGESHRHSRPRGDPDAPWERGVRPAPCWRGGELLGGPQACPSSGTVVLKVDGHWVGPSHDILPGMGGRPDKRAARTRDRRGPTAPTPRAPECPRQLSATPAPGSRRTRHVWEEDGTRLSPDLTARCPHRPPPAWPLSDVCCCHKDDAGRDTKGLAFPCRAPGGRL